MWADASPGKDRAPVGGVEQSRLPRRRSPRGRGRPQWLCVLSGQGRSGLRGM